MTSPPCKKPDALLRLSIFSIQLNFKNATVNNRKAIKAVSQEINANERDRDNLLLQRIVLYKKSSLTNERFARTANMGASRQCASESRRDAYTHTQLSQRYAENFIQVDAIRKCRFCSWCFM